jgi:hypothetical protein
MYDDHEPWQSNRGSCWETLHSGFVAGWEERWLEGWPSLVWEDHYMARHADFLARADDAEPAGRPPDGVGDAGHTLH